MRRMIHVLAVVFLSAFSLMVGWSRRPAFAADPAVQLPAVQRQLFLDDVGIAKIENLERTMHQPDKKGAVIRHDWNASETALYIGLPMMFYQTGPHPKYPNQDGYEDIQLVCSRDLQNWKRLGERAAFIPASPLGAGAYDVGQVTSPSNAVVRGDELWFYYSGFKGTHEDMDYVGEYPNGQMVLDPSCDLDKSAICLAVLRRDGFISLDAGEQAGTIQTEPFKVSVDQLLVNVDALKGELRAEMLDGVGQVVAQLKPLTGDLLREPVKWAKGGIAELKGQIANLRFTLRNGQFYSYWLQ